MQEGLSEENCLLESKGFLPSKIAELCSALEKGGRRISNENTALKKAHCIGFGKPQ